MQRFILITVLLLSLLSCSQSNKQKELELRERELALKEKELALKENAPVNNPAIVAPQKTKEELWSDFWVLFSNAIRQKDKPMIVSLSLKGDEFFDGGGGQNAKDFIETLDKEGSWDFFTTSVSKGVKPFEKKDKITKDGVLIFVFKNNKWYWEGVMGD